MELILILQLVEVGSSAGTGISDVTSQGTAKIFGAASDLKALASTQAESSSSMLSVGITKLGFGSFSSTPEVKSDDDGIQKSIPAEIGQEGSESNSLERPGTGAGLFSETVSGSATHRTEQFGAVLGPVETGIKSFGSGASVEDSDTDADAEGGNHGFGFLSSVPIPNPNLMTAPIASAIDLSFGHHSHGFNPHERFSKMRHLN